MSKFTKFPKMWREQLAGIRATGCTYRVALYLLDRASFSNEVVLSTSAMRRLGVSRNGKRGALEQLRRTGLIAVEERPDKNPIVTVRWVA
jgi:hypothetical protein